MTAPTNADIHTQDRYDEWLDDVVEDEIEEFLEYRKGPFQIEKIDVWMNESPVLSDDDYSWARLYRQVRENGYNEFIEMEIVIPAENPWHKLATAVKGVVYRDLRNRMAQRLEDDGYEVVR